MANSLMATSRSVSQFTCFSRAVLLGLSILIAVSECTRAEAPNERPTASALKVSLAVSPLVPKTADGARNLVIVAIDSAGLSNATVRLTSTAWPTPQTKTLTTLAPGKQTVEFEAPLLATATLVGSENLVCHWNR